MRAFVVDHYGTDGLQATSLPEPTPGPHDVVVRIAAASINPLDKMVRNGEFKMLLPYKKPFVLGHDLAGVITAVGANVRAFRMGDEVFARPRDFRIGAFAEFIAVHEADIALKPGSLTMVQAAAVPLVALAAWQMLVVRARLEPNQRILVHAGAGGLGSTVIQLAKHLNAHVTTTVHTRNVDRVREFGADEVIDYTSTNFANVASTYDVVIDSLGGENLEKSIAVAKPGGLVISVVGPPDPAFATQLGKPLLKPVMGLMSYKMRKRARNRAVRYEFFFMQANGAQLAEIARLYEAQILVPVIDREFPFDNVLEAMAYAESGKANGKVMLVMRPEKSGASTIQEKSLIDERDSR